MTEQEWIEKFRLNLSSMLYDYGYFDARDFARDLGVTETAVSYWINGKRAPTVRSVLNISYLLGVSLEELVDFGEPIRD